MKSSGCNNIAMFHAIAFNALKKTRIAFFSASNVAWLNGITSVLG
jgi:hypothetical protein